jgi:hypothetical protein
MCRTRALQQILRGRRLSFLRLALLVIAQGAANLLPT